MTMAFSQVEFDKPSELLKNENGRFRSLVDKSSDKDLLYQQANMAAETSQWSRREWWATFVVVVIALFLSMQPLVYMIEYWAMSIGN